MNSKNQRASQKEREMSETQQTMGPKPSDYGIDGGDPEFDQALAIGHCHASFHPRDLMFSLGAGKLPLLLQEESQHFT